MTIFFGANGFGLGEFDGPSVLSFNELTAFYQKLLIIQYRTKAKAFNTIGVYVDESIAGQISAVVQEAFNLDSAIGVQLDTLADYKGAERVVHGIDITRIYFAMPGYDDTPDVDVTGFILYGDTPLGYWITYDWAEQPIYGMNDDELRRLVKYLARLQASDYSLEDLDAILFEFFGTALTMTDNLDMTITYTHDVGDTDNLFTIVRDLNALPQPAGVDVIVV